MRCLNCGREIIGPSFIVSAVTTSGAMFTGNLDVPCMDGLFTRINRRRLQALLLDEGYEQVAMWPDAGRA